MYICFVVSKNLLYGCKIVVGGSGDSIWQGESFLSRLRAHLVGECQTTRDLSLGFPVDYL